MAEHEQQHKDHAEKVGKQTVEVGPPPTVAPRKKTNPKIVSFFVAAFLLAFAGGVSGVMIGERLGNSSVIINDTASRQDGNNVKLMSEQNIARVAKEVSPSVVSIVTNTSSNGGMSEGQAAGTGIIVSKDGYIMTNHHVIANATKVSITTSDGDVYENVSVVGFDPLNDVAFLKVKDVDDFKAAAIGNSDTLRIGQTVVAIGNSLGQYHDTVTSGIVSGLGRPVTAQSEDGGAESLTDLIQTDAAINPGNSGGPLVNLSGQVVGINTAVADANGIGFAIPIDATKGVLQSVLETGKVKKAYIGVRYIDVTPAIAKSRNLPVKQGALVTTDDGAADSSAVIKGSPADKAGIKDGDIITKINDMVVGESGNVSSLVSQYTPGTQISVTYIRDKKEHTTKVTLGEYKQQEVSQTEQRLNNATTPQKRGDTQTSPYNLFPFGY